MMQIFGGTAFCTHTIVAVTRVDDARTHIWRDVDGLMHDVVDLPFDQVVAILTAEGGYGGEAPGGWFSFEFLHQNRASIGPERDGSTCIRSSAWNGKVIPIPSTTAAMVEGLKAAREARHQQAVLAKRAHAEARHPRDAHGRFHRRAQADP